MEEWESVSTGDEEVAEAEAGLVVEMWGRIGQQQVQTRERVVSGGGGAKGMQKNIGTVFELERTGR